jgi:hypothetical protein
MWAIDSRTARSWTRFAAAMGDVGRRGESGSRVLGEPQALNSHGTGAVNGTPGSSQQRDDDGSNRASQKPRKQRCHCRLHKDQNTRSRARASRVAALPDTQASLTLIAHPGHFARCHTVEHMSLSTYYITAALRACRAVIFRSARPPGPTVGAANLDGSFRARLHHLASDASPIRLRPPPPPRPVPQEASRGATVGQSQRQHQETMSPPDAAYSDSLCVRARRQATRVAANGYWHAPIPPMTYPYCGSVNHVRYADFSVPSQAALPPSGRRHDDCCPWAAKGAASGPL